jgi:amino acid efflux transporter
MSINQASVLGAANSLRPSLSALQGIGVALSMVVGSGLLILPGLGVSLVGAAAIHAWWINALLTLPLLLLFARLGARYPTAGGVAGFAEAAFGYRAGRATEALLIGASLPGAAAIALSGGSYIAELLHLPLGSEAWLAAGVLLLAVGVNLAGAQIAGSVQSVMTFGLILLLGLLAVVALRDPRVDIAASLMAASPVAALPALGALFFAFTGWELFCSTAEEFRHPRRDFPLALAGAFLAMLVLYVGIALAVQTRLDPSDPSFTRAPVAALAGLLFGPLAARGVAALGAVMIVLALIGGIWGASRLIFSAAREGLLPGALSRVSGASRVPRMAVATFGVSTGATLALAHSLNWSVSTLFELSAQNFLGGYVVALIAGTRLLTGRLTRATLMLLTLGFSLFLASFGASLIYVALSLGAGFLMAPRSRN